MTLYEVKQRVLHDTSGLYSTGDVTDKPCPTITVGVRSLNAAHYIVEYRLMPTCPVLPVSASVKPPYQVPSMAEITRIPWNGSTVISTFSGAGGSCLGYRMAGFKVLWANEFVPSAQQSYRANAAPDCILDGRDIHEVTAEDILTVTGLARGALDLLDGSPPCQAFSMAGQRAKGWGTNKRYEHGAQQQNETLFAEYIRLVRDLQPKVFVAENVSGLLKGVAKGYFKEILRDLKACGYVVQCRLLDAQWLGVPQQRQRAIFIGVRQDLGLSPVFPTPLPYHYSVREALPWILRQGDNAGFGGGACRPTNRPSPTIGTGTQAGNGRFPLSLVEAMGVWDEDGQRQRLDVTQSSPLTMRSARCDPVCMDIPCDAGGNLTSVRVTHLTQKRTLTIAELKRICAFPDDFVLQGSYAQQWERLGNSVPPVMMYWIARTLYEHLFLPMQHACPSLSRA